MSLAVLTPIAGASLLQETGPGLRAVARALALGPAGVRETARLVETRAGASLADALEATAELDAAPILIVRALDGAPGAQVRATLLELAPQALLEGIWAAAFALGAETAVLAVAAAPAGLEAALAELGGKGGLQARRDGRAWELAVEIVPLARNLMTEEDAALTRLVEGRTALAAWGGAPAFRGRPVVAAAAETLVALAQALVHAEPGRTRLFQVLGAVVRPGLVEVEPGTTLREVVFDLCGGIKDGGAFKFALVGGPAGGFIAEAGLDTDLHPVFLEQVGACAGARTIEVGDARACVADLARRSLEVTAPECCGLCTVCREGLFQLKEILADGSAGRSRPEDDGTAREIAAALKTDGLCALGRHAADPVLTALDHFGEELEAHFKRKRCPALVCSQYVTFHILGEACTGCGKCLTACPEEAIEGEEDYIHVIDPAACSKCGRCYEVCPPEAAAVVKAGPVKPRTPREPIPVGTWKKR